MQHNKKFRKMFQMYLIVIRKSDSNVIQAWFKPDFNVNQKFNIDYLVDVKIKNFGTKIQLFFTLYI